MVTCGDTGTPAIGELKGLDPVEKLEGLGVVLIKDRGFIGKLGTVRGVLESASEPAGGSGAKKGMEAVVAVVVRGGSIDCCP